MPTYCMLLKFTDQGIRAIRDSGKRIDAAREFGKKHGVELGEVRLCMGPYDLIVDVSAKSDEAIATFGLGLISQGNVSSTTMKVFSEQEYRKLLGALSA